MQFRDLTVEPHAQPAPPPPPTPKLPYEVREQAFGLGRTRLVKVFPNGFADGLTGEELAVLDRVKWLEGSIAAGKPLPDEKAMPYEPKLFEFGYGMNRQRLAKTYPASANRVGGHWLSDEEIAVYEYVKHLEAELSKKFDEAITGDASGLPDLMAEATTVQTVASQATGPVEEPSQKAPSTGDGAKAQAEAFLRDVLKNGPVAANEVTMMAAAAGVTESTLKRAKGELGVVSEKRGLSGWVWSLPAEGDQADETASKSEGAQAVEEGQPVPA